MTLVSELFVTPNLSKDALWELIIPILHPDKEYGVKNTDKQVIPENIRVFTR